MNFDPVLGLDQLVYFTSYPVLSCEQNTARLRKMVVKSDVYVTVV